ncbi:BamA/TamA family outer membrane protein [Croceitalea sp. MTPC9]|uniref:translocation and assembly module lipoprotein TamL n=1 Tax=unclassified Croceitalea TaxID=2632280 RepID=UPI002B3E0C13|nr:BamA/TamA family outer membrane protein [Croceitalea sp. MTPC6]GMN18430.1 BamA/TamA family outer membrane protein [Croceitalea sp. MTPC9]
MKIIKVLCKFRAKIGVFLLLLILSSCNAIKKVGEEDFLLTNNTIYADSVKIKKEEVKNLLSQKPNSNLAGYPLRLNLYNLAKENPDSLYQNWLQKKPKRKQRLNSFLSEKQVNRLGQSFLVKGYSNFFKRIGEPPVIIDTSKTKKSIERIQAYYGSKGYFNNTADYTIIPIKRKKRAEIKYEVNLGKPYYIDSLARNILSSDIDSLYLNTTEDSFLKENQQFDLVNFNKERERLTSVFRNSGVYNFQESSISYDILRDTTKIANDQNMDVQMNIKNFVASNDSTSSQEYKVHRFEKINIFADYIFNQDRDSLKSIEHEGYTIFYKDELRYKPNALTDAIFFEKDSIYRDIDRVRTQRQITNLNTFKYPNIDFQQDTVQSPRLITNIYLAARPKYSLGLDFDISRSDIQQIGTALSASVFTRNVFGGAETLSLSARGSIGILSDNDLSNETFTSEIGGDINLTFPRIWFPFNTERVIPYYMVPQTRLSIGTNFQQNIGLDRQVLNTVLGYNWSPNDFVKNTFELMNIEFVRNTNAENFFNVYNSSYSQLDNIADNFDDPLNFPELAQFFIEDNNNQQDNLRLSVPAGTNGFIDAVTVSGFPIDAEDLNEVRSIEERRNRLTENNLIFSSNFTFQKNNRSDINDNSFYQYRIKLESAGNLLSAFASFIPFNTDGNGQELVFGVPYSQYVKTEFDYVKHWDLNRESVLAFRSIFGLAIPYGNSNSIPFVRSYFAGGANDNRAWQVYSLGPGRTENLNDFNEANFKLSFNLEYRFPIVGDVKGALFADAGNIWNVFDNVDNEEATFNGFNSLADIALGTGFGLRYDLSYFVFRFDLGFKTHNPARIDSERWFTDFNLNESVINIGINYPF